MDAGELRLLYRYIFPYRAKLAVITVLAIFCAFFEAINLGALVPLLQIMNNQNNPGGTLWSILTWGYSLIGVELTFLSLLVLISILFAIGQLFLYFKKKMQNEVRFRFNADLMNKIFDTILHADMSYLNSQKGGTIIDIINRESDQASMSVFVISEIFMYLLLIVVYCSMLIYISYVMTIICIIIAITCFILLNFLIIRSKKIGILIVDIISKMNEFLHERINLLKLIKIFSMEKRELEDFRTISDSYAKNNCIFMMNGVKVEIFFQIILFGLAIAVLFVSTTILQMPLPLLLIFIFILIRLTEPLRNLNNQRHVITGELASLEKIDQILSESRRAKMIENGSDTFDGFKDTIRLNQVNFSYGLTIPTLTDISFDIKKNEMVAIIGASGSGKSTIVDLIIRLMDPISGDIQIDNKNLREFNLESYHNKIGFVSQESYIFHDSVLNNICYGADRISLDEAIDAAKIANAHEFISNLPKGYRTEVGEKGIKLSGGEKQRIALARALYRNPEILILDEATSALDSESEKVIQESIAKIKNKYTIIAIAHRLSTIENADKIIVIDQGKLIESGTHQNLMQNKGIYWKYHFIQYNGNNS